MEDVEEKESVEAMDTVAPEEPTEKKCNSMFTGEYDQSMLTACLHTYYQDIFPYQEYCNWLNYGMY